MMDTRDAFFEGLYDLAKADKNIVLLTADMGALALEKFRQDFPTRFINVGIAEQNLIGLSAGMTLAGMRVFVYGIAAFIIYRCYDQIRMDLCDMNLPVTIIGAGPGLSYGSDGPSHHALYDLAMMMQLPNMLILTPHNADEAREAVQISYSRKSPTYVRLSKGSLPSQYGKYRDLSFDAPFRIGGNLVLDR